MTGQEEPSTGNPSQVGTARRQVVVAGHTGDETTARAALGDGDPRVRASALGALDRMGALGGGELKEALGDPSPVVRMRAAALSIGRPEVSPAALLDDPSDDVVETAAWACGERESHDPGAVDAGPGDPGAVDAGTVARLAELVTGHANPLVREAAVAALGAIGHPAGLAAILAATTDRVAVRRRAVLALAPFDGPEVEAALGRAAQDRDWQTRDAAELLLSPD